MIDHPKLTVVVPIFNNEKYIVDCLDSILSQTFNDLEIIIVDDCSVDNSLQIVNAYKKKYPEKIQVIANGQNVGVAESRHRAILNARGEYVTTLDSDDYYCNPTKLEHEFQLIDHYLQKKGEDVIAFSNIVEVSEDKQFKRRWGKNKIKQGWILQYILARNCMIPRDFIMKKSIYFDVGGYDPELTIYEDWDLKIRLASKNRFFCTGQDGTAYRIHGHGLSSQNYRRHVHVLKFVFKKNLLQFSPSPKFWIILLFVAKLFRIRLRGLLTRFPRFLYFVNKNFFYNRALF